MFLGTGLGPRAYAIIEQGMISRVIEAKPEELRVFLEEAAGISKYKERRRETESRSPIRAAILAPHHRHPHRACHAAGEAPGAGHGGDALQGVPLGAAAQATPALACAPARRRGGARAARARNVQVAKRARGRNAQLRHLESRVETAARGALRLRGRPERRASGALCRQRRSGPPRVRAAPCRRDAPAPGKPAYGAARAARLLARAARAAYAGASHVGGSRTARPGSAAPRRRQSSSRTMRACRRPSRRSAPASRS